MPITLFIIRNLAWIKEIELEIDAYLEEIKKHIETDKKKKAKYHEFFLVITTNGMNLSRNKV